MGQIARNMLLAAIVSFATDAQLRHASAESGVINDNRQRFSIAVPDFSDGSTSDGASWSTMAQAIASDLRASGRSAIVESNLPIESNVPTEGRVDPVPPHFDRWRGTDAKWLVIGRVTKQDHRSLVGFQLWNVAKGQQFLGQQYALGLENMQRIPHVIAEQIFEKVSGESGRADGAADRN
jgi:TolB protein